MELSLNFGQGGGVSAQSIGVPVPDCPPKSQPYLDPQDGLWHCSTPQEGGGWGRLLIMLGLGYVLWQVYSERWGKRIDRLKQGDMGALL